ncbi:MAG: hypothetical protein SFX73_23660 [Kofleriaceae bacterium]|nr:hypothetical protein [Kofleriaceae bacterium]
MVTRALVLIVALSACGDQNFSLSIDATAVDAQVDAFVPDAPQDASVTPDAPPDSGGFQLACTIQDLQPVFTCALQSCTQDLSFTCLLSNCGLTLLTLPGDCRTCLITAFASQDIATTAAACGLSLPNMGP